MIAPLGRKVPGSGPVPADLMIIGEAPGYNEEKSGRPFIGKSGKELDRYLKQAGLDRRRCYVTNVAKYRPFSNRATGNSAPTVADIERDTPELIREIGRVKPKWILAVGRVAARWLFEDDIDMDDCHGMAWPGLARANGTANGAIVIPVFHPAAGFHSPETQPLIYWDFQRCGQYVRGEIPPVPPVDQYPDPDYYDVTHGFSAHPENTEIGLDTEGVLGSVWSAQYSIVPGSAGIVLARNKKAVEYLSRIVRDNTSIIHNAPWDFRVLAEITRIPLLELMKIKFEDSMQAAFVLRLIPKGLKALGRRFKGVTRMRDYPVVVAPADRELMLDWLKSVIRARCVKCEGAGTFTDQPVSEKTGKPLQPRLVKCTDCQGDGTNWSPPGEKLEWNVKTGKLSVSSGHRMGWRVRNILKDTDKIDKETGKLEDLRKRWTDLKKKDWEFAVQVEDRIGPPRPATLGDLPYKEAREYACTDADVTKRVWPDIKAELIREDLYSVYEMDRDVIPMITRMMDVGWKIDVPYLNKLQNQLDIQQDRILYGLEQLVGHPFNPNSPIQVGEILFGQLGLHPVRLTGTGADSTDAKVLADLRIQCNVKQAESEKHRLGYEITGGILDYKERGKLKSSYTQTLPRWAAADKGSRVHPSISNVSTESGRLTVRDPALQTLPHKTELGRSVRGAFTCEDGNVLVEVDYSQVEFRLMAHESGDKRLIKAINQGVDPHNLTVSKTFGIPIKKVTKDMWQRDAAKTVGFAILYGASAPTVKMQIKLQSAKNTVGGIDIPVETVEGWIEDYTHRLYPGVGDFMADAQAEARRYGYVSDMWKRRRYLPGVHSQIGSVRNEAERIATNHKIQAGAQGIIKTAMKEIWHTTLPRFRGRGYCEAILQVHDSLVFEVKKELVEELRDEVMRVMGSVGQELRLKVPITAEGKVGTRWNLLK